jgi:hypothetical protein
MRDVSSAKIPTSRSLSRAFGKDFKKFAYLSTRKDAHSRIMLDHGTAIIKAITVQPFYAYICHGSQVHLSTGMAGH